MSLTVKEGQRIIIGMKHYREFVVSLVTAGIIRVIAVVIANGFRETKSDISNINKTAQSML